LGYPRIGPDRELKRALERYWAGDIDREALAEVGVQLRRQTWTELDAAGLGSVPSNTFSYYDQVLDAALLVGAVPDRFAGLDSLDTLFAMARGREGVPALEMTQVLRHQLPLPGAGDRAGHGVLAGRAQTGGGVP
jgi:5-methyltetrahydropteroyltriglutamate--homocysteine methyltransferase